MKIGAYNVEHRRSVCDLTISDGVYTFAFKQDEAAELAKALAYYSEHGKLNEPLKRWAIGWNRDSCMFRLHAWDGIIDITKPHTQPLYFKSETEAHTVRNALYDQQEDPPAVMPVNVVERWSRLVEVDE